MLRRIPFRANLVVVLTCIGLALLAGCAGKAPMESSGAMDSPAHHVMVGKQHLQNGDLDKAKSQFRKAEKLDPSYAQAHAGLARVYAKRGKTSEALESGRKAIDLAEGKQERIEANMALLEVLARTTDRSDLDRVRDQFEKVQAISPDHPRALMLMAKGYEQAERFREAERMYKKAADSGGRWGKRARREWKRLQDRRRIGTEVRSTAELAELAELTRAQTAALLNEELQGVTLSKELREQNQDQGFQTPQEASSRQAEKKQDLPRDVTDHRLKADIRSILALGLRGLQTYPGGEFRPDKPMLRADMALTLEDLLIQLRDKPSLARKFLGGNSPFSDVQPGSYAFNAIMLCVSKELMHARKEDLFEPNEPVSGMEALRGVRRMKDIVQE